MENDGKYSNASKLLPEEDLLAALHSMVQNIKIHQANNRLVIGSVERFRRAVVEFIEDADELTIQVAKGRFYLQGEKLPYRRGTANLVDNMLRYFEDRGLMGLRIYPSFTLCSQEEIVNFAGFLNESVRRKNPMDWLVLRLEEEKLQWISVLQPDVIDSSDAAIGLGTGGEVLPGGGAFASGPDRGFSEEPGTGIGADTGAGTGTGTGTVKGHGSTAGRKGHDRPGTGRIADGSARKNRNPELEVPGQRSPRKVYAYALESMREVAHKISGNQRAGIRNAVRIVQNMVEEVVLQDQPLLLAMSTIRVYDDYTFTHSVNVAILAMYIGKQIGLSRESLESLGISGLFHDLGKVMIPQEVLNKKGKLSEEELGEIRKHSLNSVRLILRLRASAKRKSKIILSPFEHHLKFDLTGYPAIGWNHPLTLAGRILSIADVYDALTSPRVYREEAMSPDRALGLMLKGTGTAFDPIILKVFINMLGVYPLGTLLELESGDIGLVSRPPSSHAMGRPWVLLLEPRGDGGFSPGEEIDLSEKDSRGYYYYNVAASVNPAVFNIQPAEFLTEAG